MNDNTGPRKRQAIIVRVLRPDTDMPDTHSILRVSRTFIYSGPRKCNVIEFL
jgi:hypothetical protein